jgi:hypothetical protein
MQQISELGHIVVDDVRYNLAREATGILKFRLEGKVEWRHYSQMPEKVQRKAQKQGYTLECAETAAIYTRESAQNNNKIRFNRKNYELKADELVTPSLYAQA